MKKILTFMLLIVIGLSAMAQQRIQLRSVDKAECVSSDMTSLSASFSFSTIEAENVETKGGQFSRISLPNTVIGGNEGDPQIPVLNELIAVPFGASPRIEITSYSTTDYRLDDYGIRTLVPRQPDIFKNQDPDAVPFVYNESAYQSTRGLRSAPTARVSVNGTMRGVQIGQLTIEPVSYDPANNTLRVFNNIEVTVSFDGANARATEDMLVRTYSPYFNGLYDQLFNSRALRDVYEDHPDLWTAPVKMLVIANRMFESCIQDWVAWKTLKGIYVDVNYTDDIGTSADAIKSFIQTKYEQDHPTFLIIMGDKDQVAPSIASASQTSCVADLYYSSVDGDEFVDMFHSRMSAETTAQMTALINKCLEYEQYTMPDPSYLNNVLLIAGEDSGYGVTVGRPTIWYASNYYYNAAHGFSNVYEFSQGTYTNCYAPLSSGVGFANYTAHGSKTSWAGPSFSVSDVENLTNEHKYFFAMGNCCQSGDWGYSTTCFGEALTRAENKGAYAYIGSCPNTTWYNDYYFGVGATTVNTDISAGSTGTMPTLEQTTMGCYDAIWRDDAYNTVNSVLYSGLLACNAAQALGYEMHSATLYYWQAYHVIGDGSIMPYRVQPTANQVSHMAIFPIGMATYEVSAVPGSYVAISKDGVLHGTALVGPTGTVQVPITPVTSSGDVTICVTAPQRIPYIQTVPAAALEGAYISVDGYTPTEAHVGDNINLSITFKNVGTDATTGNTNITLSTTDPNVTLNNNTGSFGALASEATITVSGFSFSINPGVADGTNVTLHYVAENGNDTYEGNIVVRANEAVLAYQNMSWNGGFTPGETLTLTAKFKNTGHFQATNAVVTMATTSNNYLTVTNPTVNVGTIAVDEEVSCQFTVTIDANCPETAQIPVTFTMTADGNLSAQGTATLKNACNVIFNLSDSYGDGWNGANLIVSFDDGTESQSMTFSSGNSATYTLEIGNGTHVTLTWSSGSYDGECSFTVGYEGDLIIFSQTDRPSAGVLYEFDCNCAAASQTYNITVTSSNTEQGTVSGGGEFGFGQSCSVTATPAEGYMFTGWTMNGEIVSTAATYTFIVNSDMDLMANFAEGNMIGDGDDATNNYLPTYNYYNYSLTEQIYTSAELGDACLITSVAFYNGGETKTRTLDLYMQNTTKSSFSGNSDWIAVSVSDKVFSGSVTFTADDWTVVTFSTPFVYDGTSNVVLVTDDNSGAYTNQPHMACRVFDAASQALYVYSDGTNYDPNSPSSYSGTVLSVKNQLLITKEAISTEPVNITVSVSPAQAGTVSGGGEIAFGETCTVSVVPNEGYFFTGWTENGAVVSSDLEYSFSATADRDLVATFVQGVEIGEFSANNTYLPSYNYYSYSLTQQIYTADEIGAAGTISWIAFYNEGAAKTRTYDLYLKTTDKNSFSSNEDWITVSESDKVFTGSVTMEVGTWTIINFTTPFEYDGTSNLVLVADDNSGAWTSSPHMTCSVFNTDENQAIYIYNDNTNFDPMSPPAASTNNDVLSVKNHILMGIETTPACELALDAVESFETYTTSTELWTGAFPGCWTIAHNYTTHASDSVAMIYRSFASDGRYSLRLNYRGIVAMPALAEDVDINHVKLNMVVRQSQLYYKLQVGVMTDLDDESTFVPVALCNNSTTGKLPFECTFASYVVPENYEGPFYIAFKNIGTAETDPYSVNYLDEVEVNYVEEIPTCDITALEHYEYFDDLLIADDGRLVPECWTLPEEFNNIPTNNKPQLYNSFAHTGNYSLKMRDLCVYAMPKYAVTSTPITNVKMTFWLRQAKKSYQLEVGVMTNANDASTFIPVQTIDNETTGKEEVTVLFNTYTGPTEGDLYIAFRNKGNTSSWTYSYNYIDDITLVDVTAQSGSKIAETADGEVFDTDRYLESIAVYPNPTTGVLHIDAVDVQKVECYSQMGQLVGVYDNADIDLGSFANGVYMLRITVPQGVTMRKVVKK